MQSPTPTPHPNPPTPAPNPPTAEPNQVCAGSEERVPRYTQLYREAADARSLFVLLDGVVEHTADSGVPSGQRVQRCDGAVVGATGAWSKSVVVVGLEALSRVPRETTATTLKECVLLRLGSNALSPDAVLREQVPQRTQPCSGEGPWPIPLKPSPTRTPTRCGSSCPTCRSSSACLPRRWRRWRRSRARSRWRRARTCSSWTWCLPTSAS